MVLMVIGNVIAPGGRWPQKVRVITVLDFCLLVSATAGSVLWMAEIRVLLLLDPLMPRCCVQVVELPNSSNVMIKWFRFDIF